MTLSDVVILGKTIAKTRLCVSEINKDKNFAFYI